MKRDFRDSIGRKWTVWMQEQEMSCAAACLEMVIALVKGHAPSEAALKRDMEGQILPGTRQSKAVDWTIVGTGSASMAQSGDVLKAYGIENSVGIAIGASIAAVLKGASRNKPCIAQLVWADGSGRSAHHVVVVGMSGRYLIALDPLRGLSQVLPANLPDYSLSSHRGSSVDPALQFSGYTCYVR